MSFLCHWNQGGQQQDKVVFLGDCGRKSSFVLIKRTQLVWFAKTLPLVYILYWEGHYIEYFPPGDTKAVIHGGFSKVKNALQDVL